MKFLADIYFKFLRLPKVLKGKDKYYLIQKKLNKTTFGVINNAWTIATDNMSSESIVYSFGIGYDISFDLEIIKKFDLKVFAFDPTYKSIEWLKKQKLPETFAYKEVGLANFDGVTRLTLPENPNYVSGTILSNNENNNSYEIRVNRLTTLLTQFGHNNIDILKMDIEGAEYDVIDDILSSNIAIKQSLVEFHHRFPNVGLKKTKETIKKLNNFGYRIFHISNNGEEYSFIKT